MKLKTELYASPKEEEDYIISGAEQVEVRSGNKSYDAIKVTMLSVDNKDKSIYTLSLWLSDEASRTSKLGSFISAFYEFFKGQEDANETDNWLEHTIKVKRWRDKDREIEVLS